MTHCVMVTWAHVILVLFSFNIILATNDFDKLHIGILKKSPDCLHKAKNGHTVTVHYEGRLKNGELFDKSNDDQPFTFPLGKGHVIQGWEQGIIGMCVSETRKLKIPSKLGYGEQGYPPKIPKNSGLVFKITLLKVSTSDNEL